MKRFLAVIVAGAAWMPSFSSAEPGLANEIYGPSVHRGETEVEVRGGVLNGGVHDGEWQVKAEFSHAFTDWWRPGVVGEWERESGDGRFTALALENVFDFTATRHWPVHMGGYFEYEWKQDGDEEVEVKLLAEHERGPLALTLNLIAEREIGSGASWEFGYAAQGAYSLNDDFALGVQGLGDAGDEDNFGDLGDQAHYWGPFAQFELAHLGDGEVEAQLGYLFGAGEAEADGQFRFKLEYEFGED